MIQFYAKPIQWGLVIMLGLGITAGCARTATPVPTASRPGEYWPTQDWKTSTPAEQGMDGAALERALQDVKNQGLNLSSLLVIRNGRIVSETYYPPSDRTTRHELYSVTKSFTATLVGIAIDKGYIDNVHHGVLAYFSQLGIKSPDRMKNNMTLENLLTMSTGLDWLEGDPTYAAMVESSNWTAFVLDRPMRNPPGTLFNYCSGCSHVLSAVVQKTAGANNPAFANQSLFAPLGIQNYHWDTDRNGVPVGGWGLQLTARDMAKLGYLFLHQGAWDGKTIVSAGWVKRATQSQIKTDGALDYGYQWWINPNLDTYSARGRYGQTIYVAPKLNLIVVVTAHMADDDPIYALIEKEILPAVKTP